MHDLAAPDRLFLDNLKGRFNLALLIGVLCDHSAELRREKDNTDLIVDLVRHARGQSADRCQNFLAFEQGFLQAFLFAVQPVEQTLLLLSYAQTVSRDSVGSESTCQHKDNQEERDSVDRLSCNLGIDRDPNRQPERT